MARNASLVEVQNSGIVYQLSLSRHPICIVRRKLFKGIRFFLLIANFDNIVHNI